MKRKIADLITSLVLVGIFTTTVTVPQSRGRIDSQMETNSALGKDAARPVPEVNRAVSQAILTLKQTRKYLASTPEDDDGYRAQALANCEKVIALLTRHLKANHDAAAS